LGICACGILRKESLILHEKGFLKWRYPQFSSILDWDFPSKPSNAWDISISGNPHMEMVGPSLGDDEP